MGWPIFPHVGFRGRPIHVRMEDGRWKEENYKENRPKWPKSQKQGEGRLAIASVSFRGHPTRVWTAGGKWKQGHYKEKQTANGLYRRNQGGVGIILHPSASFSFRRGPANVWTEDGRWKRGNYKEKHTKHCINRRDQGDWLNIASVSCLQIPSASSADWSRCFL